MTHWSFDISAMVVVICAAAALVSIAFSILQWRRSVQFRSWVMLSELLRLVIIGLIVFTLLRPELVTTLQINLEPEIVLLRDETGSMATEDTLVDGKLYSRKDWLDKIKSSGIFDSLQERFKIREVSFGKVDESSDEPSGTDLNEALKGLIQGSENLRAVVVMSDGDWNQGKSPIAAASRLRAEGIPVYPLAVGSKDYLPDLALKPVRAPAFCLINEKISIPYEVQSRLKHECRAHAQLICNGQVVSEQDLQISAGSKERSDFLWKPLAVGEYSLSIKIQPVEGEVDKENNVRSFPISARRENLKVLVIDSLPRWEYRYLRNALMRDPGVEVNTLLFHPEIGIGGGKGYLSRFPADRKEMGQYDVIFLGDVGLGPKELKKEDLDLIEGVVKHQGSGLVFIPGRRGRQITLENSLLSKMNPVIVDTKNEKGMGSSVESKLYLTQTGRDHLLTMLADSPPENGYLWRTLPGFYWHAAVRRAKPGTDILAVHSALRSEGGRMPLLVTGEYGNGTVLFMGTDSAWRWRKGVEDKYHYRFWGQVVRWMAHRRHLSHDQGIRVFYSPEAPRAGQSVFVHATVHDRSGYPVNEGEVILTVEQGSEGGKETVRLLPEEGEWGVYQGEFTPEKSGKYRLTAASAKTGRKISVDLTVSAEQVERIGYPANWRILQDVARLTQGRFFLPNDLALLVQQVKALPQHSTVEKRFQLWSQWWWGLLIFGLMIIYWIWRKAMGLI